MTEFKELRLLVHCKRPSINYFNKIGEGRGLKKIDNAIVDMGRGVKII